MENNTTLKYDGVHANDIGHIKLSKNSRGFTWEIKLLQEANGIYNVKKLKQIHEELIKQFEIGVPKDDMEQTSS